MLACSYKPDEFACHLAAVDPELAAPVLERVFTEAIEHRGRGRQSDLYWIADEALRRASRRQAHVVASDR